MGEQKAFPRSLRVALKLKHMSNKQLASLVATDEGTVSRWLTGKHTPSKKRIDLIESVMGLPKGLTTSYTGFAVVAGTLELLCLDLRVWLSDILALPERFVVSIIVSCTFLHPFKKKQSPLSPAYCG